MRAAPNEGKRLEAGRHRDGNVTKSANTRRRSRRGLKATGREGYPGRGSADRVSLRTSSRRVRPRRPPRPRGERRNRQCRGPRMADLRQSERPCCAIEQSAGQQILTPLNADSTHLSKKITEIECLATRHSTPLLPT